MGYEPYDYADAQLISKQQGIIDNCNAKLKEATDPQEIIHILKEKKVAYEVLDDNMEDFDKRDYQDTCERLQKMISKNNFQKKEYEQRDDR